MWGHERGANGVQKTPFIADTLGPCPYYPAVHISRKPSLSIKLFGLNSVPKKFVRNQQRLLHRYEDLLQPKCLNQIISIPQCVASGLHNWTVDGYLLWMIRNWYPALQRSPKVIEHKREHVHPCPLPRASFHADAKTFRPRQMVMNPIFRTFFLLNKEIRSQPTSFVSSRHADMFLCPDFRLYLNIPTKNWPYHESRITTSLHSSEPVLLP